MLIPSLRFADEPTKHIKEIVVGNGFVLNTKKHTKVREDPRRTPDDLASRQPQKKEHRIMTIQGPQQLEKQGRRIWYTAYNFQVIQYKSTITGTGLNKS